MSGASQMGTEFSFSVGGRVLQQQASTVEDAWKGICIRAEALYKQGQFGHNVPYNQVNIQLVNTAPAKG
jgi:hypothetical protein